MSAFGIHADARGLITAGSPQTQLTWMDATSHGRPVTPRYGKAVEIKQTKLPQIASGDLGQLCHDLVVAHNLLLEAKSLIESETAVTNQLKR